MRLTKEIVQNQARLCYTLLRIFQRLWNTQLLQEPTVKEECYIKVLEEFGIENAKTALEELMKAGKDEKEVTKLKIQKLK